MRLAISMERSRRSSIFCRAESNRVLPISHKVGCIKDAPSLPNTAFPIALILSSAAPLCVRRRTSASRTNPSTVIPAKAGTQGLRSQCLQPLASRSALRFGGNDDVGMAATSIALILRSAAELRVSKDEGVLASAPPSLRSSRRKSGPRAARTPFPSFETIGASRQSLRMRATQAPAQDSPHPEGSQAHHPHRGTPSCDRLEGRGRAHNSLRLRKAFAGTSGVGRPIYIPPHD